VNWLLVKRTPDIIHAGEQDVYLANDGGATAERADAKVFATREEAEAHRRTLRQRYEWVATSGDD
jgi:hypothetical protein